MKELIKMMLTIVVIVLVSIKIKTGKSPFTYLFSKMKNEKNMLNGDTIYIQGFGHYNDTELAKSKQIIEEIYGIPTKIITSIKLKKEYYLENSINVDKCLKDFNDNYNKLLITNDDCYSIYNKTFVLGLSESEGNIIIINGKKINGLKHVMLHEIGHTSGLNHCDNENCVMTITRVNYFEIFSYCQKCQNNKSFIKINKIYMDKLRSYKII